MKKYVVLFILLLFPILVNAETLASNAKSSIMIEASTGKVLFENNADEKRAPASMTKVMTLLIIMENVESGKIKLTDKVSISEQASSMGGSQVFLEAGSEMSVEELLKAITIASGNDAAIAMSEFIGGSVEKFVELMNKRAKELGMTNTNYVNPHGLDDENHYTSARDMAIVAKELVKYEKILEYTSTYEEYLKKPDGTSTWMVNTNKLIRYFSGLDGLKTGYTKVAGYCLTATAKRGDMRLISVVMGEESSEVRNKETVELLNYGFSNYKKKIILEDNSDLGKVEIKKGKKELISIGITNELADIISNQEESKYRYEIEVNDIYAPIKKNDKVGNVILYKDNKGIGTYPLVAKESVKKANIIDYYKRNFKYIISGQIKA